MIGAHWVTLQGDKLFLLRFFVKRRGDTNDSYYFNSKTPFQCQAMVKHISRHHLFALVITFLVHFCKGCGFISRKGLMLIVIHSAFNEDMYVAENFIAGIVADKENVSLQNLTRCLDPWFALNVCLTC